MIKILGVIVVVTLLGSCVQKAESHLYFLSQQNGPSINIYSVNENSKVSKHTDSERWRDFQYDVAQNGDIYFASNRRLEGEPKRRMFRNHFDLFSSSEGEQSVKRVVTSENVKLSPKVGPKGLWLAYKERDRKLEKEFLKLTDLRNGSTKVVAEGDFINFAWQNTCSCITYADNMDTSAQLYLYTLEDGKRQALLNEALKKEQIIEMHWSVDDQYLALRINQIGVQYGLSLRLLPSKSKSLSLLSKPGQIVQEHFNWSPVDNRLIYSALIDFNFYYNEETRKKVYEGSMQVFTVAATGGEPKQLTKGKGLHNRPVFSPDGSRFAFIFLPEFELGQGDLMIRKIKGRRTKQKFEGVVDISRLVWRPAQDPQAL